MAGGHYFHMMYKRFVTYSILVIVNCVYFFGTAQAEGKFYGSGASDVKEIAITFDDGPGPATITILDILDTAKIKAAFFMLGKNVKSRPDIAREVYARGHEIGNHTYHHSNLYTYKNTIPKDILDEDIKKGAEIINDVTGYQPRYVRIPYGYYRSWIDQVTKKQHVDVVHWTFGCDWKKMSEEEMIDAYCEAVKPGAILLLHDGGSKRQRKKTLAILPPIIKSIQAKGYTIVPLPDLIK